MTPRCGSSRQRTPTSCSRGSRRRFLIDEIQYAPGLLPHLKLLIDRDRKPGAFWLTGSQQFQLMKGITETLAGRVAVLHLLGFSQRERLGRLWDVEPFLPRRAVLTRRAALPTTTERALYDKIWTGSYPALVTGEAKDRPVFFASYLQTYLQRDVRDLTQVGSIEAFTRFIRACAARTAQLLNLSDLARGRRHQRPRRPRTGCRSWWPAIKSFFFSRTTPASRSVW